MPSTRVSKRPLDRRRSQAQSLVEFALILPVVLLLMLTAIDFGRIFLGWVNLQQMTRVAAGYASEHASAWGTPGDPAEQARYQVKVSNDARQINCDLPDPLPVPVIGAGTALGAPVSVGLSCEFDLLTPIIADIVGGTIVVSAQTTYPIREGAVAVVPGGGSPIATPPEARFASSPSSGWSPLEVTFVDLSTGVPSSWDWDFVDGTPTGTGTGTVDQGTSLASGPHTITYTCTGVPGDTCTFSASLGVGNAGGTDSVLKSDLITVTVPPATGPIAEFSVDPPIGVEPLTVDFDFVDLRGGTVTYTLYEWDFTSNGSFDATGTSASHTYTTDGAYDVTLRVTDSTGTTATLTKVGAVVVSDAICVVPDFANTKRNAAQDRWEDAGFTGPLTTLPWPGPGPASRNYDINSQSLVGGSIDPQPDGCASSITVGP